MTILIALILAVTMLAACSSGPITDVKNAPAEFSAPAVILEKRQGPISYEVALEIAEDSASAEDGVELASYCFQIPKLSASREDGSVISQAQTPEEEHALAAVETFNSQFADWTAGGDLDILSAAAKEDRKWRSSTGVSEDDASFPAYSLTLDCSVYQTEELISIAAEYYSYTGGAHPNTMLLAWNFDLTTGQFFTSAILAADGQKFLTMVQDEIIRQIGDSQEAAMEEGYWEDYRDIVSNWSDYAVSFDAEGMTVAFSPYELAAYAAGPQIFKLSYDMLKPYFSEHAMEILELNGQPEN